MQEKISMSPSRLFSKLQNHGVAKRSVDGDTRLQAINVTRQTKLANSVEVAGSGSKRSKGLLGRKGLAPGEALWIVPCEAVHTFGMQFSLDLVYLDRRHRIRKIRRNVPPWRISGCLSAHSVIELAAGSIRESDAQPGDFVEFSPSQPGIHS
jgi:uncharacterized membrane protein (UPF0127 family)